MQSPCTQVAVKYKNNLGYTPLHLAAKLGHLRVARELLMAGARADLKDQVCMRRCLALNTAKPLRLVETGLLLDLNHEQPLATWSFLLQMYLELRNNALVPAFECPLKHLI